LEDDAHTVTAMLPVHYRKVKSVLRQFILRNAPLVMMAIPFIIEGLGTFVSFGSQILIHNYLLQQPGELPSPGIVLLISELGFTVANIWFLWPIINMVYLKKQKEPSQKVKNRVYNYPVFLIIVTYIFWGAGVVGHYFSTNPNFPLLPYLGAGMLATMLNAILVYYVADHFNRAFFIPHFFPDGNIHITFRLLRSPSLVQRFLDLYFMNAILPIMALCGIFYITVDLLLLKS